MENQNITSCLYLQGNHLPRNKTTGNQHKIKQPMDQRFKPSNQPIEILHKSSTYNSAEQEIREIFLYLKRI